MASAIETAAGKLGTNLETAKTHGLTTIGINRRILSYNAYVHELSQPRQDIALIFAQGELNAYQTWFNTSGNTKQYYQTTIWHELKQIIRELKEIIVLLEAALSAPEPTPEPTVIVHSQEGGIGTLDIDAPMVTFVEPTPEPVIVEPTPAPIETPLVTEPVYIEATPIITPTVDDSINTNMVTQQVINFNIVNGRAVGSIKFVATNNFNPYYYNKEIINIVQFKTPNGSILLTKQNRLRFTQTERDEVINYNENIQENTRITVESFVWEWMDKPAGAFSNMYSVNISETEPPKPIASGFMAQGVAGAIAGLVLLGFIVDSKVGK